MARLRDVHPGEVLVEEFLEPMGISAYRLPKQAGIPQTRVSQMAKRRRRVTADSALRVSRYFERTAEFWLGLQDDFNLEGEQTRIGAVPEQICLVSSP